MHIFLLALLLQQAPIPPKVTLPRAPTTITNPNPTEDEHFPQLGKPGNMTTPQLNQNSPETPYQMGRDIGGQSESIGELKSKVGALEDKREKVDRPDIDSIKTSRLWAGWIISMLTVALGVLWWARGFLWRDTIRPWLRRSLENGTESSTPPEIDSPS
jgi:hypothetical protein